VSHCDPETLALLSLGESVGTPGDEHHLATCQECQVEVSGLTSLVGAARAGGPITLDAPPPAVWDRIQGELGLAARATVTPITPAGTDTGLGEEADDAPAVAAPVVSLQEHRERRSRPGMWLLAAAGVGGIVLGGGITAAVTGSSSSEADLTVAASVPLEPLPAWDTTGVAELATNDAGQQVLVVSLDQAAPADAGYQEVWLIDTDVAGMVSLGVLDGASGQFVVPEGVDVAQFPIVDVSLEPFDGDPTHSGDSIARGQIEA
jgi:anti-sigma factor RsiW